MIEVVHAVVLLYKLFWVPSIVSLLGVVKNLAENAPSKKIVNNFVINRNKSAKFGKIMWTEDAHKTSKCCKNRARDPPLRGNFIGKIPFFQFWGP